MVLAEQQSISLSSSKYNWEDIENRSKELGFNKSKYTQMLYELDIVHHILSNHQLLHMIKNSDKKHIKFFDMVILLFLLTILTAILTIGWLLL